MTSDSVRLASAGSQLGKTCQIAVRGGGVVNVAAQAVVQHTLPISPSRRRFALFTLCK